MAPEISQANEAESVEAARAFRLVGISRVTGWRLINNPDSGFPRPYRWTQTTHEAVCELGCVNSSNGSSASRG